MEHKGIYNQINKGTYNAFPSIKRKEGILTMTILYDADLKGFIELEADDSSLFQRFTIKLSEEEYYRLLDGDS